MHPIILFFLVYVALPVLRCLKAVWPCFMALLRFARLIMQLAHFLTGGVFLPRPPIQKTTIITKTLKLYVESNTIDLPFDEVHGEPDFHAGPSRSRQASTGSTNSSVTGSSDGHRQHQEMRMGIPPFFNVAIETTENGQFYQYHG
jgi:hypothetical protein